MKTIELSTSSLTLKELLQFARTENVLIKEDDGEEFLLAVLDDFEAEVESLKHNEELIDFLDARAAEPKLSLDEAKRRLLEQE